MNNAIDDLYCVLQPVTMLFGCRSRRAISFIEALRSWRVDGATVLPNSYLSSGTSATVKSALLFQVVVGGVLEC